MLTFNVESWVAIAPGLAKEEDWKSWLLNRYPIAQSFEKDSLKQMPPLLRRRLNTLGKSAVEAVLALGVEEEECIPSVFSSRHGDTGLTLSLLEEMGRDEPMSPKGFSLAVHNAVAGLYTIFCKNTSNVTAISAVDDLVVNSLIESVGQLQTAERVLCVIYDMPLPELYRPYSSGPSFPYAIAVVLSRSQGESYLFEQVHSKPTGMESNSEVDSLDFLSLLTGVTSEMVSKSNGAAWVIKKAAH